MNTRRNALIRTITAFTGDVALGLGMASACVWVIQSAALGLFLSFLVWLLGTILCLALSQFVVHPTIQALLSDHKLDQGIEIAVALADLLTSVSVELGRNLWALLAPRGAGFSFSRKAGCQRHQGPNRLRTFQGLCR
jgi:hypothetical protein